MIHFTKPNFLLTHFAPVCCQISYSFRRAPIKCELQNGFPAHFNLSID
ncbi:uncharacterized protein J3R85_009705 [Psidium guajava]|nr:uncharacterized protein J3R85_009705 [Psidium guajava]